MQASMKLCELLVLAGSNNLSCSTALVTYDFDWPSFTASLCQAHLPQQQDIKSNVKQSAAWHYPARLRKGL